jgi:hypothetical protein
MRPWPVRIVALTSPCGCTSAVLAPGKLPLVLGPYQQTAVDTEFDTTRKKEDVTYTIKVATNNNPEALSLTIKALVQ